MRDAKTRAGARVLNATRAGRCISRDASGKDRLWEDADSCSSFICVCNRDSTKIYGLAKHALFRDIGSTDRR
jgi:hypothetical protein